MGLQGEGESRAKHKGAQNSNHEAVRHIYSVNTVFTGNMSPTSPLTWGHMDVNKKNSMATVKTEKN